MVHIKLSVAFILASAAIAPVVALPARTVSATPKKPASATGSKRGKENAGVKTTTSTTKDGVKTRTETFTTTRKISIPKNASPQQVAAAVKAVKKEVADRSPKKVADRSPKKVADPSPKKVAVPSPKKVEKKRMAPDALKPGSGHSPAGSASKVRREYTEVFERSFDSDGFDYDARGYDLD